MITWDPITYLINFASGALGAGVTALGIAYKTGKQTQKWDTAASDVIKLSRAFEEHKEVAMTKPDCEKLNDELKDRIEIHYRQAEDRVKEVKETALQTADILRDITKDQFADIKEDLRGVNGNVGQLIGEVGKLKGSVEAFHEAYYKKEKI